MSNFCLSGMLYHLKFPSNVDHAILLHFRTFRGSPFHCLGFRVISMRLPMRVFELEHCSLLWLALIVTMVLSRDDVDRITITCYLALSS